MNVLELFAGSRSVGKVAEAITEQGYLEAKRLLAEAIAEQRLIAEYEIEQLNKYAVIGRFSSLEECEKEAISFTKDKLKVVNGLLSEDYKTGYKEGVEHYLASKNDL